MSNKEGIDMIEKLLDRIRFALMKELPETETGYSTMDELFEEVARWQTI